ncbi:MAG TPA: hypothetical protein VLT33_26650 [Labilithrix sp.]|nr:hypothetical protein [Labilithrix sp.]
MRIPSRVSLVSLLAVATTVAACDLSSGSSCTEYDGCYPGYGSSGYGSSGYPGYPGYDASTPRASCTESFSVAFSIPAQSGDCKLVLGSEHSTYAGSAIYYFAEAEGDAGQPCETLDGPAITRCAREHDVVVLASARPDEVAALRAQLALAADETSFSAELSCARAVTPWKKTVVLRCGSATPATPVPADAGADPDAAPPDSDAGDASASDAEAAPLLH